MRGRRRILEIENRDLRFAATGFAGLGAASTLPWPGAQQSPVKKSNYGIRSFRNNFQFIFRKEYGLAFDGRNWPVSPICSITY
jgi:hypothetical protein